MKCPCGSNELFTVCCNRYISGDSSPPTPEALMRSRYSAYTQANIDYIQATMRSTASEGFDPISAEQWARQAIWQGLQIVQQYDDPDNSDIGFVEFKAYYQLAGKDQIIHELSEFHKIDQRWFYVAGKQKTAKPISRNQPCPCGSGKKYKRCCGSK